MSFVINRVYTRTGDKGETALVSGERVEKNHPRVHAFGDIDELNSVLGLAKEELPEACIELRPIIIELQQQLFDLGAELATETPYPGMWKAEARHVLKLEELCDKYGDCLPPLTSFILPGGSKFVGFLHLARTVARRAERNLVELFSILDQQTANYEALKFINRLSDFLFILCRWSLIKEAKDAPLWIKEKDRSTA